MEVTSTASKASLQRPISLAFNWLEGGSLIFMLSLSIRQSFFLKFCVITIPLLSKLSRLDQSPSVSIFFLLLQGCSWADSSCAALSCRVLPGVGWERSLHVSHLFHPSNRSPSSTFCLSSALQPLWHWPQVSLAGQLQSQQSAAERSHLWLQIQNIGWSRGLL